jgi:hypothetical protein
MRRCLILACLLALLAAPADADDVFLKGGGKVTGRILSRTEKSLEIDIGPGRVTLSMNSVERVEEGRSALDDYYDKAAALESGDANGWLQLARWAAHEGLLTQARAAYERVVDANPGQAEANRALRRVELNGRWVTEEESYQARGYVHFEGAWITPREQDAVLREREAVAQAERARFEAEQRTREAEARALEAEARAQAAYYPMIVTPTIPSWFDIWGQGPALWPPGGRWPAVWPSHRANTPPIRMGRRTPSFGPARSRPSRQPASSRPPSSRPGRSR